jgi:hypothetical protein
MPVARGLLTAISAGMSSATFTRDPLRSRARIRRILDEQDRQRQWKFSAAFASFLPVHSRGRAASRIKEERPSHKPKGRDISLPSRNRAGYITAFFDLRKNSICPEIERRSLNRIERASERASERARIFLLRKNRSRRGNRSRRKTFARLHGSVLLPLLNSAYRAVP